MFHLAEYHADWGDDPNFPKILGQLLVDSFITSELLSFARDPHNVFKLVFELLSVAQFLMKFLQTLYIVFRTYELDSCTTMMPNFKFSRM